MNLLRIWFIVHFIVDIVFAIPLLFFPGWVLGLFGIVSVETVTPRLVGAALVGIGGASFFTKEKDYSIMLTLKILWSFAAIMGLALALIAGAPKIVWLLVLVFFLFNLLWVYYKIRDLD